jgi:hypothetical protein
MRFALPNVWFGHYGVQEGDILRLAAGVERVGDRLHTGAFAYIVKRVAQWIGMSQKQSIKLASTHCESEQSKTSPGISIRCR